MEDTSWDREVSTVNQFYLWAFDQEPRAGEPGPAADRRRLVALDVGWWA
ncbi:hypothetical protein [Streptomyces sp. NPDC005969]